MSGVAVTADARRECGSRRRISTRPSPSSVRDHRASVRDVARVQARCARFGWRAARRVFHAEDPGRAVPRRVAAVDRIDECSTRHDPPVDAFVMTAERGSAYTLLHPEYSVACRSRGREGAAGLCRSPAATRDDVVHRYLDRAEAEGRHDRRAVRALDSRARRGGRPPRWSVMRDVLHWDRSP